MKKKSLVCWADRDWHKEWEPTLDNRTLPWTYQQMPSVTVDQALTGDKKVRITIEEIK